MKVLRTLSSFIVFFAIIMRPLLQYDESQLSYLMCLSACVHNLSLVLCPLKLQRRQTIRLESDRVMESEFLWCTLKSHHKEGTFNTEELELVKCQQNARLWNLTNVYKRHFKEDLTLHNLLSVWPGLLPNSRRKCLKPASCVLSLSSVPCWGQVFQSRADSVKMHFSPFVVSGIPHFRFLLLNSQSRDEFQ